MRLFRKPKIEITVNDSGFDNPTSGSIKKQKEIWTGQLVYPNKNGKLFEYFSGRDVIKVYLGLDELPDKPTFTGFVTSDKGENVKTLALHGRLYAAQKDDIIIDQYNNQDGQEVSQAIRNLINLLDISFIQVFTGTDPQFYVPKTFRYESGSYIYPIIKALRDMAYDDTDFSHKPLKYFLYEEGEKLMFTKESKLLDENVWFNLVGGDNLIKGAPVSKTYGIINKQTVIGKDGVKETYKSENRILRDGTNAGKPLKNDKFLTAAECYQAARVLVRDNNIKIINTKITALELIDAVPGLTIVNISNAKNIQSGLHRVNDVNIRFGSRLSVDSTIEKDIPVFGSEVAQLLPQ